MKCLIYVAVVVFFAGTVALADVTAPAEEDLPRKERVSQGGITWHFDDPVPVGRFVNGDYYVVGPATITAIDPAPAGGLNGSVKNLAPRPHNRSGFDHRTQSNRYEASLRSELPITLEPGDSLMSSISADEDELRSGDRAMTRLLNMRERHNSRVWSYSMLTCLAAPVPQDTFRPGYADRRHRLYSASDLQTWRLHNLGHVEPTPDIDAWAEAFRQPWLDIVFFHFDSAVAYQPHYARENARSEAFATLLLHLDFPAERKQPLLINFVQHGIDLWSIVRDGEHRGWHANGGHGSGRKWAIVFAGLMLGDEEMASPCITNPDLRFGQDMQTLYDEAWTGADVVYAGHRGVWQGEPVADNRAQQPYEHLHPSEWKTETFHYPWLDEPTTHYVGERYRRSINSKAWVGMALAGRIMRAEQAYAHDAFFDYVDRWMTEDDEPLREEIMRSIDTESTTQDFREPQFHAGQSIDDFIDAMWDAYRDNLPPHPESPTQD